MASATTSNYLHQKYLDACLKGSAWVGPTNIYIAFFTTAPALDGTGGTEVTTSGTAYARVLAGPTDGVGSDCWTGPSGTIQEYSNVTEIAFAVPTANWGTIVAAGLYDASTGGNLLYVATLATPRTVNLGDGAPRILANQFKISRAVC